MGTNYTCNDIHAIFFPGTIINPFGSIIIQFSSLCFLFASMFTDILLVRISLVLGNGLLFIQAMLGWPLFPCWENSPNISIDSAFWGFIACLMNFWSMLRLLMDEREIAFSRLEEEELWRFFFRKSGIPKLSFMSNILPLGAFIECDKDYEFTDDDINNYFHLVVEGIVKIDTDINGEPIGGFIFLGSGECFDICHANALGLDVGFLGNSFTAVACTKCILFAWPVRELELIGKRPGIARDACRLFFLLSILKTNIMINSAIY